MSALVVATVLATSAAGASVTISSKATENMSCSNGVCAPTASAAILNVGDLENMLASGNVEVTTTGTVVQAKDVIVKAAVSWSSTNTLGIDAYRSITVNQPVSIQGVSGLALTTNDGGKGGELTFGPKGNITFTNVSSSLLINGAPYTLVNTVQALSNAIAANPSGAYALAANYDAKQDGTYTQDPITTEFYGTLEGLGNTISHLRLGSPATGFMLGIGAGAVARDVALLGIKYVTASEVGGLAEFDGGTIEHCQVTGSIKLTGDKAFIAGGIAAYIGGGGDYGTISDSWASVTISGGRKMLMGGLVGLNQQGLITRSFALGNIVDRFNQAKSNVAIGGLVGFNDPDGQVSDSYASGGIEGTSGIGDARAGGLVGYNEGLISESYSTGALWNLSGYIGGFIGYDETEGNGLSVTYWDTDTSGITNLNQGAGWPSSDPGITGLASEQLQSGLPAGFDPKIWAEDPNIINGFPYLVDNPPGR